MADDVEGPREDKHIAFPGQYCPSWRDASRWSRDAKLEFHRYILSAVSAPGGQVGGWVGVDGCLVGVCLLLPPGWSHPDGRAPPKLVASLLSFLPLGGMVSTDKWKLEVVRGPGFAREVEGGMPEWRGISTTTAHCVVDGSRVLER